MRGEPSAWLFIFIDVPFNNHRCSMHHTNHREDDCCFQQGTQGFLTSEGDKGDIENLTRERLIDLTFAVCDNSCTMNRGKAPGSMTDVLRRTIIESGASYKSLSRETGVA